MGHLPGGSVVSVVVAVLSIRKDTYQMMSAQFQCRRRKSLMPHLDRQNSRIDMDDTADVSTDSLETLTWLSP
jgi:hypothetical protein